MNLLKVIPFFLFSLILNASIESDLHIKTFGDSTKRALIFVHGGPDYNAHDFEVTTALNLSQLGYFVVSYDQRGQGRSKATDDSQYNYSQYADDIKSIIDHYKLKDVVLLGHSHGGAISIRTLQKYPQHISKVALLSAPLDWKAMSSAIFKKCGRYYQSKKMAKELSALEYLEKAFLNFGNLEQKIKIGAVAVLFRHAGSCQVYTVSKPTDELKSFFSFLSKNPVQGIVKENLEKPLPGFLQNENYIRKNLLSEISPYKAKLCGLYGKEDGLFTPESLREIHKAIDQTTSGKHFQIINGASHNLYYEQQQKFFEALKEKCSL